MGGNHSIGIANGYHKDIQARVLVREADVKHLKAMAGARAAGIGVGAAVEIEHELFCPIPGFVEVGSGMNFKVAMEGVNGRVYVTIQEGDHSIAHNLPLRNGRNLIISKEGRVLNAKKGEIWKDDRGNDHSIASPSRKKSTPAISKALAQVASIVPY